jgi:hypothetical protein
LSGQPWANAAPGPAASSAAQANAPNLIASSWCFYLLVNVRALPSQRRARYPGADFERSKKEFAMKRLLAGLLASPLAAFAQSQSAPEPPVEAHPIGTLVFVVLFVGFCVVFAWMVWRKKDDKKEDGKPQA